MAFPSVIVECAFNSILGESSSAQSGYTEITKFVESVSGTLRGRAYELDQVETGSITIALDNADGRFTPGSPNSPYFPYVKANRRLRIRGNNLQRLNIGRAGGQKNNTEGFFRNANYVLDASDGVTMRVTEPALVAHNPVFLGFDGALLDEPQHIEATLKAGATAGSYRVISYWCPVELGVRSSHSAYVWKVSGTEPSGTLIYLVNSYYDADGVEIEKEAGDSNFEWTSPTPSMPTRRVFADLPPGNAAYMIQSVALITTSTATTDVTYAVAGVQSEIPTANLVPSISGYYDVEAWELSGGGTVATGGITWSDAFVLATMATDTVEFFTTVPHLVPGDQYTFVAQAKASTSGPAYLLTADDGLSGTTVTNNNTYQTARVTFTATSPEQAIKFIPQAATDGTDTLSVRLARCSYADAALPLATGATDTDETDWARPIPIFDGWVERWPIKTTAAASTISITVNDRLKKLGDVIMASTLDQTLITDEPSLLIPLTDSPTDSQGVVSILGKWSDDSSTSQLAPQAAKFGPGAATFALGGIVGPTDEDAVKLTQVSSTQGYGLFIPYSADYTATPPISYTPKPVPKPSGTTYKKTYYGTWSRSFNGSNATRFDDPPTLYQGASLESGDSNGNQRSLLGFNIAAIMADLKGTSVTGLTVSLYSLHWWYYAGGTAYIGYHTYSSKPSTWSSGSVTERKFKQTKWPRNAWRTVNLGAATGVLFQKGTAKGIAIGYGDSNHETYGYFAGATQSKRPYLTITYKK